MACPLHRQPYPLPRPQRAPCPGTAAAQCAQAATCVSRCVKRTIYLYPSKTSPCTHHPPEAALTDRLAGFFWNRRSHSVEGHDPNLHPHPSLLILVTYSKCCLVVLKHNANSNSNKQTLQNKKQRWWELCSLLLAKHDKGQASVLSYLLGHQCPGTGTGCWIQRHKFCFT